MAVSDKNQNYVRFHLPRQKLLALLQHFCTCRVLTPLLQGLLLEVFNDLDVSRGNLLKLRCAGRVGGISENLLPEHGHRCRNSMLGAISLVGIFYLCQCGVLAHPQQGQALVYRLHGAGAVRCLVYKYRTAHNKGLVEGQETYS